MFNHRARTITFAAFLLAVSGVISRFLGLIRDRLLAGHFGASAELDIYFAAFRIPDFVYGILIIGGISVAFLPIFSDYFHKKDEDDSNKEGGEWPREAAEFVNNLLNSFLLLLVAVCGILAIFTPFIISFIIPGFSPASKELTIQLTRLMFLSPIIFGLSSIFSGILQYFDKFLVYSLAPILYNLGIIFGIVFFVPIFGIYGLAYGVIAGALFHLLIQIPAARASGFRYIFILNLQHLGLKKVFKLMIPRLIGTAADNFNLIVITAIASTLAAGSIAIFNFANNLQYFPIGIVGVSFAVSSFPVFSRFLANGQKKEFLENFSSSFRQIMFLVIPISILMFILRAQAVRLVLGSGAFDWRDTRLTAACVGIFAFGILANSLIPLLTRAFFSHKDTKTPVTVGVSSVILNVIFSLLFVYLLKESALFRDFWANLLRLQDAGSIEVIGLPLALSAVAIIQLVFLLFFLFRKTGDLKADEILQSLKKIFIAVIPMAGFTYFAAKILAGLVDMQTFGGIFLQTTLAASVGISVYLLNAFILKSPEINFIKNSILKWVKRIS